MFSAAKDAMASRAAQAYLNNRIARYGRLQELRIDSRARTMEGTCLLDGERTPITIQVERYEISERDGAKYLTMHRCRCARPWLQNLLRDFVEGRSVELPAWAAAAL
ncbi:MAG: hypothetical protein HYV96_05690 [Opitutae bacterium]|nr:hypothetical protein [Opitutae bacterium]